jgi:hypothetical protein
MPTDELRTKNNPYISSTDLVFVVPKLHEAKKLWCALAMELVKVLPQGQHRRDCIHHLLYAAKAAAKAIQG